MYIYTQTSQQWTDSKDMCILFIWLKSVRWQICLRISLGDRQTWGRHTTTAIWATRCACETGQKWHGNEKKHELILPKHEYHGVWWSSLVPIFCECIAKGSNKGPWRNCFHKGLIGSLGRERSTSQVVGTQRDIQLKSCFNLMLLSIGLKSNKYIYMYVSLCMYTVHRNVVLNAHCP